MVVDTRTRNSAGEPFAQNGDIQAFLFVECDDDEARHRQLGKIETGTEPRLQEFLGLRLAVGADRGNPRHRLGKFDRFCRIGVEVAASRWADLNGHFAGDLVLPAARCVAYQNCRAGGQRGKKGHDGDDGDKRATGDGRCRDKRHLALHAALEAKPYGAARIQLPPVSRCRFGASVRKNAHLAPQS
ncbi:MAG: hypothetical protein ACREM8_10465 [Vulcanimicrobiaceae bacterium]